MNGSTAARRVLVLATALGLAFALPAEAASPGSGTLSKAKRSLKWSGSHNVSFPALSQLDFSCEDAPGACDHFSLKANLGEGALIEVKVISAEPCPSSCTAPVDGNDIDLFISDANGNEVARGTTEAGVEKVRFKHKAKFRNKIYDVAVLPWMVRPGTTYKGTVAAITLGR